MLIPTDQVCGRFPGKRRKSVDAPELSNQRNNTESLVEVIETVSLIIKGPSGQV